MPILLLLVQGAPFLWEIIGPAFREKEGGRRKSADSQAPLAENNQCAQVGLFWGWHVLNPFPARGLTEEAPES